VMMMIDDVDDDMMLTDGGLLGFIVCYHFI
jgi:hypothetical protein